MQHHYALILRSSRPAFLLLAPACVALGAASAIAMKHEISLLHLLWLLLGALACQLSVNWLNEYYDFKSGLDHLTEKTPFSGGSGALQEQPSLALWILALGLVSLVMVVSIGFFFVYASGFGILLMGMLGILLIVGYTEWINRMPRMCLIAPGLGFGIFIVLGVHIALAQELSWSAMCVALMTFFWVNNLLLVNQLPDIDADRQVGRQHFTIVYGMDKTQRVYLLFALMPYAILLVGVLLQVLPILALLSVLTLPLSLFTYHALGLYRENIAEHHAAMAANVAVAMLGPWLLAIALFLS